MKKTDPYTCTECPRLQENNKMYQQFISRFSHEIRNPLTLISSSLQLLEKDCPEVLQSVLWLQIQDDLQSTLRLLKDVSALNNPKKLCISQIPLLTFLTSLAASFRSSASECDILFTVNLTSVNPALMIRGDEVKLREAIINLLMNAADAVKLSGLTAPPEIILSAEVSEQYLLIHVRDNGPGIPEEYLPTLFDPFVTHKSNGTGLGLNIVKNIADRHNGSISVDTRCHFDISDTDCPSYTDFCLSLPLN